MRRALRLAAFGAGHTSPNPMVGAVIVARGRIIGEGWHHAYGGPHAEVNAVNSVSLKNRELLSESTIYVTLEPCSHYGKTPPCAKLLIDCGIPRIVVGAPDPNPLVSGRGVRMLREAGREVTEGVLKQECMEINRRFMTAQTLRRPYVQLKYARTADGFMAHSDGRPLRISTPLSAVWMHRERSMADAIMVGVNTIINDNPRLDCRLWPGENPIKVSFDSDRIPADSFFLQSEHVLKRSEESLEEFLNRLFEEHGISSMIVEGGAATLRSFISDGLADEIRVETAPFSIGTGIAAPEIPTGYYLKEDTFCEGNSIRTYRKFS